MAFPVVEWIGSGSQTVDTTTHVISMPPSVNIGDRICVFFTLHRNDAGTNIYSRTESAGLNHLINYQYSQAGSNLLVTNFFYDIITADVPTLTITTNVTEKSSHIVYRLSGTCEYRDMNFDLNYDAFALSGSYSPAGSTSSNATPGPVTFDSANLRKYQDYLIIVNYSSLGTAVATDVPSGFESLITVANSGADGASLSSARRLFRTYKSITPGSFITPAAQWICNTIVITPKLGYFTGDMFVNPYINFITSWTNGYAGNSFDIFTSYRANILRAVETSASNGHAVSNEVAVNGSPTSNGTVYAEVRCTRNSGSYPYVCLMKNGALSSWILITSDYSLWSWSVTDSGNTYGIGIRSELQDIDCKIEVQAWFKNGI